VHEKALTAAKPEINTSSRIFTQDELKDIATPYADRIIKCIRLKKFDDAISLCNEMKESQVMLHDFFADSCTVLWSWIGENLGENTVEEMFRYVFEQTARRQTFELADSLSPGLAILTLAKIWRSHSCFEAGECPGKFRITEDNEKFTFYLDPCGSGGRLWRKGWYESSRGGKVSEKGRPWTFNRQGFPYYCIHCSFLNEILPYEVVGYPLVPIDPLKDPEDVCTWYVYKSPHMIPERFYERSGLKKKALSVKKIRKQYYSEDQLRDMTRPTPERIRQKLQNGDTKGAIKLWRDVKDEFMFLHDLYVHMLVATYTFISEKSGESALGEALDFQYEKCIVNQIISKTQSLSPRDTVELLAVKIFGVDNVQGSGFPKGQFTIEESDTSIVFTLDPCGSGGRMLRGGAYEPLGPRQRWLEALVNSVSKCASKFLPDFLVKLTLPLGSVYIMDRKPYSQGRAKRANTWSFGKQDIPYYCCLCGKIQEKLGDSCLEICPPETKNSPCLWKIDKG
jgi:hypothetical protein